MDCSYRLLVLLSSLVIWIIGSLGCTGSVLAMATESDWIAPPDEVSMPFSGYLMSQGRFTLWGVPVAGAFGCALGSAAACAVGGGLWRAALHPEA